MPKAPVNGIDLYYESHGEGPAVVFAHGVGGNHLIWWQQVPFFSRNFRCITFDHRGFGQSIEAPDGPGARGFVEDLRALLDHLGVQETFLVAQSMGGIACLGFALAYPHRSLGLILGSTTGAIGEDSVVVPLREHQAPTETRDRFAAPSFAERDPERTFLYMEMNALNPPRPAEYTAMFRSGEGPKAAELAQMKVPTLLIAGSEDRIVPNHVMETCHKLIPGSRMEVVAGSGHSIFFEKPEEYNRLISDFFSEVLSKKQVAAPAR